MFSRFFKRKTDDANLQKPATLQDVTSGKAIFFIPKNMSRVFDLGAPLPAEGYVKRAIETKGQIPIPVGTPLVVVQAETGPKGVVVGVRINGTNLVCMLDDIGLGKPRGADDPS